MGSCECQGVIACCSFCSRPNTDVGTLVAGPGVFICNECVGLCSEVIEGKPASVPQVAPWEREATLGEILRDLTPVAAASARVERNLAAWVNRARSLGATWTEIGDALGVTRQSAWERFSREE